MQPERLDRRDLPEQWKAATWRWTEAPIKREYVVYLSLTGTPVGVRGSRFGERWIWFLYSYHVLSLMLKLCPQPKCLKPHWFGIEHSTSIVVHVSHKTSIKSTVNMKILKDKQTNKQTNWKKTPYKSPPSPPIKKNKQKPIHLFVVNYIDIYST